MAKLGDVLPIQYGKGLVESVRRKGAVPVYGSSGIVGFHDQALTAAETLIVGRKGSVGSVYYSAVPCWPIDTVYFTAAGGCLDLRYFSYLLTFLRLDQHDKSTAVPGLSRDDYNVQTVPVPPHAEQRRIVAAIEEQFTRLEAGVAALKRAQARLKRYRASVLKAAVEGKLTESWRAANPPSETAPELLKRILAERRTRWEADLKAKGKDPTKVRYEEPRGPEMAGLPEVPDWWWWATVEQVAWHITKGSSPKWQGFDYNEAGVPFVRSQNVRWGSMDLSNLVYLPKEFNDSHDNSVIQTGDVLLNLVGASVGRSAVAPSEIHGANTNQAVAIIRTLGLGLCNRFLAYYFNSPHGQQHIGSTKADVARANFNLDDIRAMPLPLPRLSEQKRIVAEIEQRLSLVSELEKSVETNLKRAERLRQSILAEAFAGRLVAQDPSDEPASVLLERIREGTPPSPSPTRGGKMVKMVGPGDGRRLASSLVPPSPSRGGKTGGRRRDGLGGLSDGREPGEVSRRGTRDTELAVVIGPASQKRVAEVGEASDDRPGLTDARQLPLVWGAADPGEEVNGPPVTPAAANGGSEAGP